MLCLTLERHETWKWIHRNRNALVSLWSIPVSLWNLSWCWFNLEHWKMTCFWGWHHFPLPIRRPYGGLHQLGHPHRLDTQGGVYVWGQRQTSGSMEQRWDCNWFQCPEGFKAGGWSRIGGTGTKWSMDDIDTDNTALCSVRSKIWF